MTTTTLLPYQPDLMTPAQQAVVSYLARYAGQYRYAVVALVMFILIITIPFGVASARIALFCLWPFGRVIVRRPDAGTGSLIGNVIWFVLAGWWLALGHLITGVLMCVTIIGVPLGLANFKLIPVSLTPFGRDIVDVEPG